MGLPWSLRLGVLAGLWRRGLLLALLLRLLLCDLLLLLEDTLQRRVLPEGLLLGLLGRLRLAVGDGLDDLVLLTALHEVELVDLASGDVVWVLDLDYVGPLERLRGDEVREVLHLPVELLHGLEAVDMARGRVGHNVAMVGEGLEGDGAMHLPLVVAMELKRYELADLQPPTSDGIHAEPLDVRDDVRNLKHCAITSADWVLEGLQREEAAVERQPRVRTSSFVFEASAILGPLGRPLVQQVLAVLILAHLDGTTASVPAPLHVAVGRRLLRRHCAARCAGTCIPLHPLPEMGPRARAEP
mmetsp:Transcript_105402/g.308129  ORF Transcript_105402/g.308129 Transcript_105402/m.308129 type:complete len:300 (+) Transcript_105402:945-1844(+)